MSTNSLLTTVVYFNDANGSRPFSSLSLGHDGALYGTTQLGGAFGLGTVFKMTLDGTLTTLFSFDGTNGARPYCNVLQAQDGGFYGLTAARLEGTNWTYGTVFRLSNGTLKTLLKFDGTNGMHPVASLILGRDGNLYGTLGDEFKKRALDENIGSIFRLAAPPEITSIVRSNEKVMVTWSSFNNGSYSLEYKDTQTIGSNWTPIGSTVVATNESCSVSMPIEPVAERYLRVVLLP